MAACAVPHGRQRPAVLEPGTVPLHTGVTSCPTLPECELYNVTRCMTYIEMISLKAVLMYAGFLSVSSML